MLKKLLKYEYKATARMMLPIYLLVLVLSLGMRASIAVLDRDVDEWLAVICIFVIVLFVISVIAVFVMQMVITINRFRLNLLSDEGYVMFTLPVSVHQLVWSKLIVSVTWMIGALLVTILSVGIITMNVNIFLDMIREILAALSRFTTYYALNVTAVVLESLAVTLVSCISGALQIYAAMAIGYSCDRHKFAISIGVYVGFQFVMQMVLQVILTPLLLNLDMFRTMEPMLAVHITMLGTALWSVAVGAVFYFITTHMLTNKLNLE